MSHGVIFSTDFDKKCSNSIHLRKQWTKIHHVQLNTAKKNPAVSAGKRLICYRPNIPMRLIQNQNYGVWIGRGSVGCMCVAASVNRLNSKFGLYNSIKPVSNRTLNYYAGQLRSIKNWERNFSHFSTDFFLFVNSIFIEPIFLMSNRSSIKRNGIGCIFVCWISFNAFSNVIRMCAVYANAYAVLKAKYWRQNYHQMCTNKTSAHYFERWKK